MFIPLTVGKSACVLSDKILYTSKLNPPKVVLEATPFFPCSDIKGNCRHDFEVKSGNGWTSHSNLQFRPYKAKSDHHLTFRLAKIIPLFTLFWSGFCTIWQKTAKKVTLYFHFLDSKVCALPHSQRVKQWKVDNFWQFLSHTAPPHTSDPNVKFRSMICEAKVYNRVRVHFRCFWDQNWSPSVQNEPLTTYFGWLVLTTYFGWLVTECTYFGWLVTEW